MGLWPVYLGDILIYIDRVEEHKIHVRGSLEMLEHAGSKSTLSNENASQYIFSIFMTFRQLIDELVHENYQAETSSVGQTVLSPSLWFMPHDLERLSVVNQSPVCSADSKIF